MELNVEVMDMWRLSCKHIEKFAAIHRDTFTL